MVYSQCSTKLKFTDKYVRKAIIIIIRFRSRFDRSNFLLSRCIQSADLTFDLMQAMKQCWVSKCIYDMKGEWNNKHN